MKRYPTIQHQTTEGYTFNANDVYEPVSQDHYFTAETYQDAIGIVARNNGIAMRTGIQRRILIDAPISVINRLRNRIG